MIKLEIVIEKDGSVKIEAIGYKGKACLIDTQAFEEALGKVANRTAKPEQFHVVGTTIKTKG